ncbi:MAG: ParB/RepB/Spo0J family partition protein [Paludibacteraceae bacterium]|nr:ParB/RepB/Spo0J family partition protein [Paludibacteraceae bacterium]
MAQRKKFELGRGLESLLGGEATEVETKGSSAFSEIDIDLIFPNPEQPRTHFDQEAIDDLAASIKELGIIQPITVRKTGEKEYQIISGERRFRAAKQSGLKKIPAYIKTAADDQAMQMAIVENLQREDLSAIELALGYKKLIDEQQLTQEKLSNLVGKKRATITNYLRLLKLPAEIQVGITEGKIDMAHARAIISLVDTRQQLDLYARIIEEHLSVRAVEQIVRDILNNRPVFTKKEKQLLPQKYEVMRSQMAEKLGHDISLIRSVKGKGKITISFDSDEELNVLYNQLCVMH